APAALPMQAAAPEPGRTRPPDPVGLPPRAPSSPAPTPYASIRSGPLALLTCSLHLLPLHELRQPDAEFVEEHQRRDQEQGQQDHVPRRQHRRHDRDDEDRVAPLLRQHLRIHDPQRRQRQDHHRQFEEHPERQQQLHHESQVRPDHDVLFQTLRLEPHHEPERDRQRHEVRQRNAHEEQHHPHVQRRHDVAPLRRRQRRRNERPELIEDDREGQQQPHHQRQLDGEEERLGGTQILQFRSTQQRPDRLDQQVQDLELLNDHEADRRADQERHQAPKDPPPELLQVLQERHLVVGPGGPEESHHGKRGSSTWLASCASRALRALSSRSASWNSSMSWNLR